MIVPTYETSSKEQELIIKRLQQENAKLKRQQKEFIEFLEGKEKELDLINDPIKSGTCRGILNRYKKIIGDVEDE